jgi:hypothetical protein
MGHGQALGRVPVGEVDDVAEVFPLSPWLAPMHLTAGTDGARGPDAHPRRSRQMCGSATGRGSGSISGAATQHGVVSEIVCVLNGPASKNFPPVSTGRDPLEPGSDDDEDFPQATPNDFHDRTVKCC